MITVGFIVAMGSCCILLWALHSEHSAHRASVEASEVAARDAYNAAYAFVFTAAVALLRTTPVGPVSQDLAKLAYEIRRRAARDDALTRLCPGRRFEDLDPHGREAVENLARDILGDPPAA